MLILSSMDPLAVIKRIITPLVMFTLAIGALVTWSPNAGAQTPLGCDEPFAIVESFPEGSKWETCWGHGANRGIYYYNFYYTPPGGPRIKVIADGWISQIQVAYDNNEARFHDVSGALLGLGGDYLRVLPPEECSGGELLSHEGNAYVCKRMSQRPFQYTASIRGSSEKVRQPGHYLDLFSASQTGNYSYIPVWRLFSDGSIELIMGATGKLERTKVESECDPFDETCNNLAEEGWLLDENDYYGISHTHNYFWRIDFDIGVDDGSANMLNAGINDVFEQIEFVADQSGTRRNKNVNRITNEAALFMNADRMRTWRIRDPALTNGNGHNLAWYIEPQNNTHSHLGAIRGDLNIVEEFLRGDVFVTTYKQCERFVSFNNVNDSNADCAEWLLYTDYQGNQAGFVDNESIVGKDQVVYLKLSFHHTPRDEDEPNMHSHWNSIKIVPRNVTDVNPHANNAEAITLTPGVTHPQSFGHEYAQGQHFSKLTAEFDDTGEDLLFTFEAFDMDQTAELIVRLNGAHVGWARLGGNNMANRRQGSIYLPRELQTDPENSGDRNVIEVIQRVPGERWGISKMLLRSPIGPSVSLALDDFVRTRYGWRYGASEHRDILPLAIAGDGNDKKITLRGFDITDPREALVFVNGVYHSRLTPGLADRPTGTQTLNFTAAQLPLASNRVVIVQSQLGDTWGATHILLENP